jgi:plastocyanin
MLLNRRAVTAMLAGAGLTMTVTRAAHAAAFEVGIDPALAKFEPETISIKVGDTVTWTNNQLVTHTVTCDPAKSKFPGSVLLPEGAAPFDSGDMEQDDTFQHQFTVAGEYRYFCIPHEDMKMIGTVVVS